MYWLVFGLAGFGFGFVCFIDLIFTALELRYI